MRIGFDAHAVGRRQTGNETYALGVLHGLAQIGIPVNAYGYSAPPGDVHTWRRLRPSSRWVRIAVDMPLAAVRDRLDLYHGSYALPPLAPCHTVVTVHDLTFISHPEWLPRGHGAAMRYSVGLALKQAAAIIAVSQRTKADIVHHYRIQPERITVTHLAPRPQIVDDHPDLHSRRDYFLCVGSIEPRKNIPVLIRALAMLRDRHIEVPLVLAGAPGAAFDDVQALIHDLHLGELVRFSGYVTDRELQGLYSACTAVVHPSLFEGFGLTPLEAMTLGRPVLAAHTGSLPEVIGDAGLLLPPTDPEAWACAMEQVLSGHLNSELAERGWARAQRFSWERCARETVGVYRRVLQ
jgi:glycosyltransferase involved in cell wall biosynthesis